MSTSDVNTVKTSDIVRSVERGDYIYIWREKKASPMTSLANGNVLVFLSNGRWRGLYHWDTLGALRSPSDYFTWKKDAPLMALNNALEDTLLIKKMGGGTVLETLPFSEKYTMLNSNDSYMVYTDMEQHRLMPVLSGVMCYFNDYFCGTYHVFDKANKGDKFHEFLLSTGYSHE